MAQDRLTGRVTVSSAEHRVYAGPLLGVERSTGVVVGGGVLFQASGWAALEVDAWVGALRGRTEGAIDRDAAQLALGAGIPATPWLTVDGAVVWRVYTSAVARQRWTVLRVGGEARVDFHDAVGHSGHQHFQHEIEPV